jgi:hypothetical protein
MQGVMGPQGPQGPRGLTGSKVWVGTATGDLDMGGHDINDTKTLQVQNISSINKSTPYVPNLAYFENATKSLTFGGETSNSMGILLQPLSPEPGEQLLISIDANGNGVFQSPQMTFSGDCIFNEGSMTAQTIDVNATNGTANGPNVATTAFVRSLINQLCVLK